MLVRRGVKGVKGVSFQSYAGEIRENHLRHEGKHTPLTPFTPQHGIDAVFAAPRQWNPARAFPSASLASQRETSALSTAAVRCSLMPPLLRSGPSLLRVHDLRLARRLVVYDLADVGSASAWSYSHVRFVCSAKPFSTASDCSS